MKKVLVVLVVLVFSTMAMAGEANLSWDASAGATGYKIYTGTAPGTYSTPTDVGNVTASPVSLLDGCVQQYVAATAYNATGESGFSAELPVFPRPIVVGEPILSADETLLLFSGGNFAPGMTVAVDGTLITFIHDSCVLFSVPVTLVPTVAQGVAIPFQTCNGTVCMTTLLLPVTAPTGLTAS